MPFSLFRFKGCVDKFNENVGRGILPSAGDVLIRITALNIQFSNPQIEFQ